MSIQDAALRLEVLQILREESGPIGGLATRVNLAVDYVIEGSGEVWRDASWDDVEAYLKAIRNTLARIDSNLGCALEVIEKCRPRMVK